MPHSQPSSQGVNGESIGLVYIIFNSSVLTKIHDWMAINGDVNEK